jgi:hypothetical protein
MPDNDNPQQSLITDPVQATGEYAAITLAANEQYEQHHRSCFWCLYGNGCSEGARLLALATEAVTDGFQPGDRIQKRRRDEEYPPRVGTVQKLTTTPHGMPRVVVVWDDGEWGYHVPDALEKLPVVDAGGQGE